MPYSAVAVTKLKLMRRCNLGVSEKWSARIHQWAKSGLVWNEKLLNTIFWTGMFSGVWEDLPLDSFI